MAFRRIVTSTPQTHSGTAYTGKANGIFSVNDQVQLKIAGQWAAAITAPGAPTITSTSSTDTVVNVSFTAPSVLNGETITGYIVTSSGGQTATGTSSPIAVTGLVMGTPYTFTVAANSKSGAGTPSVPSSSIQLIPLPGRSQYTTSGTYSWYPPAGVYSVSVVAVGGGGGGRASGWGQTSASDSLNGGDSSFGSYAIAGGGGGGYSGGALPGNRSAGGIVKAGTGTNGSTDASKGDGHNGSDIWGGSGGGGAGLLGGGTGAVGWSNDWNAQGGTGASITGVGAGETGLMASIGEVGGNGGLYGGGGGGGRDGNGGGGGAIAYANNITVTAGTPVTVVVGSGGITSQVSRSGGSGGSGAVRILWPGTSRSFPSTDVNEYATVLPGTPIITGISLSLNQVTVTFTGTTTGKPILGYTVTSSTGVTATGITSPIVVTGLTYGTTSTFTVTANNSMGAGTPSAASSAIAIVYNDPYWSNVTLLLKGGGAYGNQTFTDLSSFNRSIALSGNTFNTATGSPVTDGGGIIVFDGNGDYLSINVDSSFVLDSSNWTVEYWYYTSASNNTSFAFFADNVRHFYVERLNGALYIGNTSSNPLSVPVSVFNWGVWHHVAITADWNGRMRLWVDGTLQAGPSAAYSTITLDLYNVLRIGRDNSVGDYVGAMTEIRFTRGVERYTANFTPPTRTFPTQ